MDKKNPAGRVKVATAKNPSKNEHGLTWQQESYAQLLASGRTQADAYRAAYPASQAWKVEDLYSHASALAANGRVSARVKTLRAIIAQQAIDEAATDKAWVMRRLKTVAERCLQAAPVLDKKGFPVLVANDVGKMVPAFMFNPMGANRALELIGKENSMFIERKETGKPGDFSEDEDVLRQRIRERGVKLGLIR